MLALNNVMTEYTTIQYTVRKSGVRVEILQTVCRQSRQQWREYKSRAISHELTNDVDDDADAAVAVYP